LASFFLAAKPAFRFLDESPLFFFSLSQGLDFGIELLLPLSQFLGVYLSAFSRFFMGAQTKGGLLDEPGPVVAVLASVFQFAVDLLDLLSMLSRFSFSQITGLHLCRQLLLNSIDAFDVLFFLLAQHANRYCELLLLFGQ